MFEEGPLRKFLRERQPLLKGLRSPVTAIYPPVDSQLERMREAKKQEWRAKGYPDGLIDHALVLADRWISSMADAFSSGVEEPERSRVREAIVRGSYGKALEVGEHWITAMMK